VVAINSSEPTIFSASKLLKHLDRIVELQSTGDTRPVMVGVDLTNVCNHRCPMCNGAPGALTSDRSSLSLATLEGLAKDFNTLGVKAVALGGGGDPSVHPQVAEILRLFKSYGLETAMFTNGQLMRESFLDAVVDCCSWIRISLDADGPEMFKATHGMDGGDWDKVLVNTRNLVERRARRGSPIVIGASFLIGSHTRSGIYGAAAVARELGVDYIRMRPYFTWNGDLPFDRAEAEEVLAELERAMTLSTDKFIVSYPKARTEWVSGSTGRPTYKKCRIHHFITEVNADGKVHLCCHTKYNSKYILGDLYEKSFIDMWHSEQRKQVYRNIDFNDCAIPCKMSAHNEILEMIDGPVMHPNFL
jgi:MoaA/NifB/PqqE/SkfB family radical SAM enzyme